MQHVAIMKKEWKLIAKILNGEKILETRWYKNKYSPWDKIKKDDLIYFKNSGERINIKALVTKVEQYEIQNEKQRNNIIEKVWENDLGKSGDKKILEKYSKNKNFCIIIYFDKAEKIKPFNIDKKGFGNMASWICIEDVGKIRI